MRQVVGRSGESLDESVLETYGYQRLTEQLSVAVSLVDQRTATSDESVRMMMVLPQAAIDELALIQMERPAEYPVIEGISRGGGESTEGMAVAIIGYPAGTDTPMEGTGNDFMALEISNSGDRLKRRPRVAAAGTPLTPRRLA